VEIGTVWYWQVGTVERLGIIKDEKWTSWDSGEVEQWRGVGIIEKVEKWGG
jgi:hypothetical protein